MRGVMFDWSKYIDKYNPYILFIFKKKTDKNDIVPVTKYHCHDFLELSIVMDGEVEYHIEGMDYLLKKGDVLLANPGVYHKEIINDKSKNTMLYIAINNFSLSNIRENYIDNKGMGPIVTFKNYNNEFLSCCEELIEEQNLKKKGYELILKSLVMKLLVILCREIEGDEVSPQEEHTYSFKISEKQNMVKEIIEYIDKHYKNNISLDKIAKNMYVSPVYISKIFKEETGESPINHLIKVRLSKAEWLLKNTNMSIRAVAESVGYKDAYHFSKSFKKNYGISPSELKRK